MKIEWYRNVCHIDGRIRLSPQTFDISLKRGTTLRQAHHLLKEAIKRDKILREAIPQGADSVICLSQTFIKWKLPFTRIYLTISKMGAVTSKWRRLLDYK